MGDTIESPTASVTIYEQEKKRYKKEEEVYTNFKKWWWVPVVVLVVGLIADFLATARSSAIWTRKFANICMVFGLAGLLFWWSTLLFLTAKPSEDIEINKQYQFYREKKEQEGDVGDGGVDPLTGLSYLDGQPKPLKDMPSDTAKKVRDTFGPDARRVLENIDMRRMYGWIGYIFLTPIVIFLICKVIIGITICRYPVPYDDSASENKNEQCLAFGWSALMLLVGGYFGVTITGQQTSVSDELPVSGQEAEEKKQPPQ